MCRLLGFKDDETLRKHYRSELDEGKDEVDALVSESIVSRALGGDTTLLIFYAKTRMGWRETNRQENISADLSNLTDEQLKRIADGEDLARVLANPGTG